MMSKSSTKKYSIIQSTGTYQFDEIKAFFLDRDRTKNKNMMGHGMDRTPISCVLKKQHVLIIHCIIQQHQD